MRGHPRSVTLEGRGADSGLNPRPRVAIIGGGWAGLACALALRELGPRLDVFESSPLWGGRARAARLRLAGEEVTLDCGQHLLVGAYRACLAAMEELGPDVAARLARRRLRLASPSGLELRRLGLPGPLGLGAGLLLARGLSANEKVAAIRLMSGLRAAGWRPGQDVDTVSQLVAAYRQPQRLVRRLWEPLCVGALNTPADEACATSFAAVLRDTLGGPADASDLLLPQAPLCELLSSPAVERLREAGVGLHPASPVAAPVADDGRWRLELRGHRLRGSARYEHVVIATDAHAAAKLATPLDPAVARRLEAFRFAPIATAWLAWRADVELPEAVMLDEDRPQGEAGQWLFDRGRQAGLRIAAVVVSARDRLAGLDANELGAACAAQVSRQLGLPPPDGVRVVTERRATWRCTADRPRLAIDALAAAAPGTWLAGDYLEEEYPATLESAIRCGRRVAGRIGALLS